MHEDLANAGFLVGTAISLFGAAIHWVAPVLGAPYYAALGSPRWVVESARKRTWPAPAGALVIGGLMFLCALYGVSGMGYTLPYLPLARVAIVTIAALCLARGLVVIPYFLIDPRLFTRFHVVAGAVWFSAGAGFAVGAYGNWARLA